MRSIRLQYALGFGVMGCLLPYLSVYLEKDLGLSRDQIGWVFALNGIAIIFAPVIVSYLADRHLDARRLMAAVFGLSALALAVAGAVEIFLLFLLAYGLYTFAFRPLTSLQDAIFFGYQQQKPLELRTPYHRIRVWGTYGFIVPSVILFVLLDADFGSGLPLRIILYAGAALGMIGMLNTWLLPDPQLRVQPSAESDLVRRLPTLDALRAMLEPHVLVFCCAMFILQMATASYFLFYPVYLHELGFGAKWLGIVTTVGVLIEIGYMHGFDWLSRRLGMRRLMIVGVTVMGLRTALLAAFPHWAIAIGIQVLHGMAVLTVHVVPPVFLDRHAQKGYRSSMQGLYTMIVPGAGMLVGSALAGYMAQASLTILYWYATGLALLAALLFLFAFNERPATAEPLPDHLADLPD